MTKDQKIAQFTAYVRNLAASCGLSVTATYVEQHSGNVAAILTVNLIEVPTRPGEQVGTEYGVAPPLPAQSCGETVSKGWTIK